MRHGVWPRSEGGVVLVSSEETAQAYVIRIEDDGVGYDVSDPPPVMRGHGIGIKNSVYRLEAQVNGAVTVASEVGKGTSVTITIPKVNGGRK